MTMIMTMPTTTARMEPIAMTMLTAMRIRIPTHIPMAATAITTTTIIMGPVQQIMNTIMTILTITIMITTIMIIPTPMTRRAKRFNMAAGSPACMSPA
jgi:hypothetical protein